MICLSHHVDTFKESLYLSSSDLSAVEKYNLFFSSLIDMKEAAQEIKAHDNDLRYVPFSIDGRHFRVMAVSVTGYSVVLRNSDVSIAFRKHNGALDNNPQIKIEYRSEYLVRVGVHRAVNHLKKFIIDNIYDSFVSKCQELHYAADVSGVDFGLLDYFSFKTRARSAELYEVNETLSDTSPLYFSSRRFTGFLLGGGNFRLRLYDKSHHIKTHIDSAFIENIWRLHPSYKEGSKVWRFEFQIRREKLKTLHHNGSLEYTDVILTELQHLWSFFLEKFSYRDLTRDQSLSILEGKRQLKNGTFKPLTREAERKILSRANVHPLWEFLNFYPNNDYSSIEETRLHFLPDGVEDYTEAVPLKIGTLQPLTASNPLYVKNSLFALLSTCVKHYGYVSAELLNKIVLEADRECEEKNGYGLVDRAVLKHVKGFYNVEKHRHVGSFVKPETEILGGYLAAYVASSTSPALRRASGRFMSIIRGDANIDYFI